MYVWQVKLPSGYTARPDGTFAKTITIEWGITRKCRSTETLVRSATGKLLSVEGRPRRKRTAMPKERLPYKKRPATT